MPPSRVPPLKPKQVLAALQRAGFYIHHQTGSHARLLHVSRTDLKVTVPVHNKDLPPSFVRNRILKQASLSVEDFLKLL
jgi:predicted RNA binding protein YcfA (HicA-like mRNA interferase family)